LEKTEGKNTLRSKGLQFAYIRDLISLVGILLHKEKELLVSLEHEMIIKYLLVSRHL